MLALFKPWGTDYQNNEFANARSFTSLWSERKAQLCKRLSFHAENFESLRKSKEEVSLDQAKRKERLEMTGYNSGFDTDNDAEYFDRDSDDDTDEDVLTQDISVGISQIALVVDERGFWATMPDLQRIKDLRHGLRSTERYTVGRWNNFGMFPGNYEEMSKHWIESLKVQERRLKLKECGSEAVGDIEDDDEENDNEDNEGEDSE